MLQDDARRMICPPTYRKPLRLRLAATYVAAQFLFSDTENHVTT